MKKTLLIIFILSTFLSNDFIKAQDCYTPTSVRDLNVNNVRARIPLGASFWWDGADAGYFFPNGDAAIPQVASLFAGALWIGGLDSAGNLQLSATTYGLATGQLGYSAGPIPATAETCANWDTHFMVNAQNLDDFLNDWADNGTIDNAIHPEIAAWPAKDNPHFFSFQGFDLPSNADLAPFIDQNQDGIYDPMDGDYPDIKGATQAIWSISNTSQSGMPLEIHTLAYAYSSNEPSLNNTTFYDFSLINKNENDLLDAYISLWIDPDLGCYTDDYVGCLPEEDMAFVYNQDATDGSTGCTCQHGINTYCETIPVLGIKLLEVPQSPMQFGDNGELIPVNDFAEADTLICLGMTSFMLYYNGGLWDGPPQMTDPTIPVEYYNYMKGLWRDGSKPIHDGEAVDFLYPGNPGAMQEGDWTACSENLPVADARILLNTGPFVMPVGAMSQFSFAVTGVENVPHPCPDVSTLIDYGNAIENYYENGITTSIKPVAAKQNEVLLAPNPMQNQTIFTLKDEREKISTIQIFAIDGSLIFASPQISTNQYILNNELPESGMYIYNLQTNNGKLYSGKIVKH